ncbi:MAG: 3-hydroxyacyl-ACP dehydratase [Proteobacteria bacterium]|nr:3-hydroxyacyl-ACP dehydratase [Pseudomonadota bacterium]
MPTIADSAESVVELDRLAIERLLPHRGDALCIRSVRLLGRDRFDGAACWAASAPALAGHFPGLPIVPAVLIVEAAAQIAGAGLLAAAAGLHPDDNVGVLAAIRRCAFRRPVFPGQEVRYGLRVDQASHGFASICGSAAHAGQVVAELAFVIGLGRRDRLRPGDACTAAPA